MIDTSSPWCLFVPEDRRFKFRIHLPRGHAGKLCEDARLNPGALNTLEEGKGRLVQMSKVIERHHHLVVPRAASQKLMTLNWRIVALAIS